MIIFGERSYELPVLSIRRSAAIRARFQGAFARIDTVFAASSVEITNQEGMSKLFDALLGIVKNTVLRSTDLALDIVCEYAPNIAADREWILDNATDAQAIDAFLEVVKDLYPFGSLTRIVSGLLKSAMLTNYASHNGENGPTN